MINSYYLDPSNVTDEYAHRLQASACNARVRSLPHESVLRQRLGQLVISLGERVQGQQPSSVTTPADLELATN